MGKNNQVAVVGIQHCGTYLVRTFGAELSTAARSVAMMYNHDFKKHVDTLSNASRLSSSVGAAASLRAAHSIGLAFGARGDDLIFIKFYMFQKVLEKFRALSATAESYQEMQIKTKSLRDMQTSD
eukprot:5058697-Pleurochrysis_carterae.AAC.6